MGRAGAQCADCGVPPWSVCRCDRDAELAERARETCDAIGHELEPTGGGLLVCARCGHEEWSE